MCSNQRKYSASEVLVQEKAHGAQSCCHLLRSLTTYTFFFQAFMASRKPLYGIRAHCHPVIQSAGDMRIFSSTLSLFTSMTSCSQSTISTDRQQREPERNATSAIARSLSQNVYRYKTLFSTVLKRGTMIRANMAPEFIINDKSYLNTYETSRHVPTNLSQSISSNPNLSSFMERLSLHGE